VWTVCQVRWPRSARPVAGGHAIGTGAAVTATSEPGAMAHRPAFVPNVLRYQAFPVPDPTP